MTIRKYLKIIIPAVAVLAIVVMVIVFSEDYEPAPVPPQEHTQEPAQELEQEPARRTVPFDKIVANLEYELEQRINNSPLIILRSLIEILDNGTLTAGFEYRDTALLFGGNIRGTVNVLSDMQSRRYVIEALATIMFMNIDIEAHVNRERIALRSGIVGDEFYGFAYETLRDDIHNFASILELDAQTLDNIVTGVENFGEILNRPPFDPDNFFAELVLALESSMDTAEFTDDELTGITTVQLKLTDYAADYILVALHICQDYRLHKADIHTPEGNRSASFNFGSDANDTWTISTETGFEFSWKAGEIQIANATITSSWLPDSGDFTISYDDGQRAYNFSGNFHMEAEDILRLRIDSFALSPTQQLALDITATTGANIPDIQFISIDQWDNSVLNFINFITGFIS